MSDIQLILIFLNKLWNGVVYLYNAPFHEIWPYIERTFWYLFLFWLLWFCWQKWKKAGKR
jgi:hypothetical protein